MPDSLVIANTIELLGGGVLSANPLCPGAMFQLQQNADPGAPQPTTQFIASLLLDGERPFGRRASNRTIKLPILISAPNRQILAAAREVLQQAIDQDYFTVTWSRDPLNGNPGNIPLTAVFDCFRAQPTVPVFNTRLENQLCKMQLSVTIPALPYARADQQVQVSFTAPAPTSPAVPPPPTPVILDDFATISSVQCFRSPRVVEGAFSCCFDPDGFGDPGGQETAFVYGSSFAAPVNLVNMTSLRMWLGFGSRWYAYLEYHGKIHGVGVYVTLTDAEGDTLSFSRGNLLLPVSADPQSPTFSPVSIPIPQGNTTFDYANVASYRLEVINRQDRIRRLSWVTAYLNHMVAYPGSQQGIPVAVTHGAIYTINGPKGTARAPVTMSFQQQPTPGTPTVVTTTGAGSYTTPANTAYLAVKGVGGGGAGAGRTSAGVGPGGAGAEAAQEQQFPSNVGDIIPYVVGAGDTAGASPGGGQATVFGPAPGGSLQLVANGGGSVPTNGTAAGVPGSGSANSVEHPGGAGRANPTGTFGGGGGSSGGDTAAGNTPQGSGSVPFTTAGAFTWVCPNGVFAVTGTVTGAGGGGGAGGVTGNGAGGGGGEVRSGSVPVTPGVTYNGSNGTGGAGGTSAGNGSAGTQSIFTGDGGVSIIAKGGGGGLGNAQGNNGRGSGGTGGTGATGFPGGQGGSPYPYTGGGGSSAGPTAQGNPGSSPTGATAPSGGGAGGTGSGPGNGVGSAGVAPGGGGGGSYVSGFNGGAGATGQVILTFPSGTGAPTNVGGLAVTGGGAGGAGGATTGTAGSAGSQPGGGGGGANSSGSTLAGGAGGAGKLTVTPFAPSAFKTLIVHRPPLGTAKTFMPLVSIGAGADAPDGTHQYTMPQPVTGVNADFGGTYSVYLTNSSWSGGSSSATARTITVTVTQFEYAGGPGYPVATIPISIAPNQVNNGIVVAGVLTLPVKVVAPDNLGGYYTVTPQSSNTSDRFLDCLFLDTMGQTVVINEPSSGYVTYYIDVPDPNVAVGRVMGTQTTRANAIGVMDHCDYISGGTMYIEPSDGDNQLFVYSADGSAPNVSMSYYPCYFFDRTQ